MVADPAPAAVMTILGGCLGPQIQRRPEAPAGGRGEGRPGTRSIPASTSARLAAGSRPHRSVSAARARGRTGSRWPRADSLQQLADELEKLVTDDLWPLPKYRELLFQH